jgi:hypothetical protein
VASTYPAGSASALSDTGARKVDRLGGAIDRIDVLASPHCQPDRDAILALLRDAYRAARAVRNQAAADLNQLIGIGHAVAAGIYTADFGVTRAIDEGLVDGDGDD